MERAARAAGLSPPLSQDTRFGLAVSGGPDSLALLLLAEARFRGRVEAATFDHGFRAESAAEAAHVAAICAARGIPHMTLRPGCELDAAELRATERQRGGLQALARAWRYRALGRWCAGRGLRWLLTAHHADDQAETVLMRLARGSGTRGLSGIRPALSMNQAYVEGGSGEAMTVGGATIARPLLRFSKRELHDLATGAALAPVDDPSNADARFDRTRARRLLAETDWLDARRLASVADIMRETEEAMAWAVREAWREHVRAGEEDDYHVDPAGLPPAILRRLCEDVIWIVEEVATGGASEPYFKGAELTRFVERLRNGEAATLCHVMATPGERWHFEAAPPRREKAPRGPRFATSIRLSMEPPRLSIGTHDPPT
jgi:tRNA(Ile)-lysidine synthase